MQFLSTWLLAGAVILSSGCSMCASGYLDDYATVGGKWQRSNPTHGRVGSIFSDAGETVSDGTVARPLIDAHPSGIEGTVFGDAYTEEYEEYIEGYPEDSDGFEPQVQPGDDAAYYEPQWDGELTLGDEW